MASIIWCTISELCILNEAVPLEVADKLIKYHIAPMTKVRTQHGSPIWASMRSGYRPEWYERQKGRSGKSEHTFKDKGAVDWTTKPELITGLVDLIISETDYSRICFYPNNNFIHCDYKNTFERWFYKCDSPTSKWKRVVKIS